MDNWDQLQDFVYQPYLETKRTPTIDSLEMESSFSKRGPPFSASMCFGIQP